MVNKLTILQSRRQIEIEEGIRAKEAAVQEAKQKKIRDAEEKKRNLAARSIQNSMRNFVKRKKELDAMKGEGKKKKGGKGKGKKK